MNASPSDVFNWLEANELKSPYEDGREEIEMALLKRNDSTINLGLALFTNQTKPALYLYRNSIKLIKCAILENFNFSAQRNDRDWSDILRDLVEGFQPDLLRSFFSNPNIDEDRLYSLYSHGKTSDQWFDSFVDDKLWHQCMADIDDEKWLALVSYTIGNKRLTKQQEETTYDGMKDHTYNRVVSSAWSLFETLPVNGSNAVLLAQLSENLHRMPPYEMNVLEVAKRWSGSSWAYLNCRKHLAKCIKPYQQGFSNFKKSEDVALRMAYYSAFRPSNGEEIQECYDKDGTDFLLEASYNDHLYTTVDKREALRNCAIESEMMYLYNHRESQLETRSPELFESTSEVETESIERAKKYIRIGEWTIKLSIGFFCLIALA